MLCYNVLYFALVILSVFYACALQCILYLSVFFICVLYEFYLQVNSKYQNLGTKLMSYFFTGQRV